jgi:hypothetical protein
MIGTRILKIDLEIAEIIEVKVATFNIKIHKIIDPVKTVNSHSYTFTL